MAKLVPVRFNDDEEAVLMKAFGASQDEHLSTHLKRRYFEAVKADGGVLEAVQDEIQGMRQLLERIARARGGGQDDDMSVALLCGIFLMVWRSVSESVRLPVGKAVDVEAVEAFLKGVKR